MTRWSESVKSAINWYNEQAILLDPPADTVQWQDIANYTHVGEFEMLHIARSDIWQEKWVQKAYCDAGIKFFKLCRAREEIQRLNVEVRRLLTWIHDENKHMQQVIKQLSDEPHLADELRKRWALWLAVNQVHLERIKILQSKDYYTGLRGCREVVGSLQPTNTPEGVSSTEMTQNDQDIAEIEQEKDLEIVTKYYLANIDD